MTFKQWCLIRFCLFLPSKLTFSAAGPRLLLRPAAAEAMPLEMLKRLEQEQARAEAKAARCRFCFFGFKESWDEKQKQWETMLKTIWRSNYTILSKWETQCWRWSNWLPFFWHQDLYHISFFASFALCFIFFVKKNCRGEHLCGLDLSNHRPESTEAPPVLMPSDTAAVTLAQRLRQGTTWRSEIGKDLESPMNLDIIDQVNGMNWGTI